MRQQFLHVICSVLSEKLGKAGWKKDKEKGYVLFCGEK